MNDDKEKKNGFLVRTFAAGEGVLIGPDIEVMIRKIADNRTQLAIRAPKSVPIQRIVKPKV